MFEKVLVANRGEIALRIMRTCRRLGIQTVAVYSDADEQAEHTRFADMAVHLGSSRAQDSYLKLDALLDAIRDSGADAVHPGYGLLSEDPEFARQVRAMGVSFIGPSEANLKRFGDKVAARQFAASLGIASPPGTEQPLVVSDSEQIRLQAERIGYPLLVKAAAGGGGIGMQPVQNVEGLEKAIGTCVARSQAAFGDTRVYLERYFQAPRHIEVQVVAGAHGDVFTLGERECSVQRRYQKILEEAPSPASALNSPLQGSSARSTLHDWAVKLLKASGYQGVGTVEFLVDLSENVPRLYFLEVNARLQVEHPVTEMVYGVDLVELQLQIAAGLSLSEQLDQPQARGHAVEVRLYAEDPGRGFIPQPGTLVALKWPESATFEPGPGEGSGPYLRVDSGYIGGNEITPFYDPLIAKLIAWGESRPIALDTLAAGLRATELSLMGPKGPKTSNLEFLRELVQNERLRSGEYDTGLVQQLLH